MRRIILRLGVCAGLCVCICLAAGATASKGAPKPPAQPQVTVGFSGQAGDGMLGDSFGNYVGGVNGVVAELQPNGNTPAWSGYANLLVNIVTTGGRNHRYFTFNYAPVSTDCTPVPTGPSATNSKYAGVFNIHSIGAIGIREVRAVRAYVFAPDGEFGWTGEDSQKCATTVAAYRTGWGTWVVSTDVARLGLPSCDVAGIEPGTCTLDGAGHVASATILSYLGFDGKADANGNYGPSWQTPSGLNQLGFTTGFIGNYDMPFAITVSSTDTRLKTNYVSCGGVLTGGAGGCSFPY